jgi:uncharacterized membrane protein
MMPDRQHSSLIISLSTHHHSIDLSFSFLNPSNMMTLLSVAFLEPPGAIGCELSIAERLRSTVITLLVIFLNYIMVLFTSDLLLNQMKYSVVSVVITTVCAVSAITMGLYVHNVYIVNLGGAGIRVPSPKAQRVSTELDSPGGSKKRLLVSPQ